MEADKGKSIMICHIERNIGISCVLLSLDAVYHQDTFCTLPASPQVLNVIQPNQLYLSNRYKQRPPKNPHFVQDIKETIEESKKNGT